MKTSFFIAIAMLIISCFLPFTIQAQQQKLTWKRAGIIGMNTPSGILGLEAEKPISENLSMNVNLGLGTSKFKVGLGVRRFLNTQGLISPFIGVAVSTNLLPNAMFGTYRNMSDNDIIIYNNNYEQVYIPSNGTSMSANISKMSINNDPEKVGSTLVINEVGEMGLYKLTSVFTYHLRTGFKYWIVKGGEYYMLNIGLSKNLFNAKGYKFIDGVDIEQGIKDLAPGGFELSLTYYKDF